MATTTELIALNDRQYALLWIVDGIEIARTNDSRLVGYVTGAGHDVRLGLQLDGLSTKIAIDLRGGQFLDCTATIPLTDFSIGGDELASMFAAAADDARSLGDVPLGFGTPVHPWSDLTSRPELDEQNIGIERIGANGARHQFAVPPGFDIGLEHSITTPALDLEGAPVSEEPIVWLGRRWALYMVFRDHVTYPDRTVGLTAFRPFSEARLLGFGTMRDQGDINGSSITLEVDGPSALLHKPLGVGFSPEPTRAEGDITLVTSGEEREDGMFVQLFRTGAGNASYGISNFATFITGTTADEFRDDLITEINAVAGATGVDGVWSEQAGYHVAMTEDGGVDIQIQPSVVSGDKECGTLVVVLHETVWNALGYDPIVQGSLFPDDDDERAVLFSRAENEAFIFPPGPNYWVARFRSAPSAADAYNGDELQQRTYKPLYLGGTCVLLAGLNGGRGQLVRLGDSGLGGGISGTSISHPGQLAWPVASLPTDPTAPIEIDGTPCDRCGWWLFMGKRRYEETEEVFDERWIGLASWVNGGAGQDGLVSGDTIIVTHWFDPAMFGYTTKSANKPATNWVARADATPKEGQIQAVPIFMLGYHSDLDQAHIVLQRLLASTGTCEGWDGPEQSDPGIVGGDNEPADAPSDGRARDAEIAALGLAIPQDWIATPDEFDLAISTIDNPSILDVKITGISGCQAEDVIRSLMQPAGLCWHMRGGRFGIWNPSHPLTLADVEVVFDRSEARVESHANAGQVRLLQGQRMWQPIDTWKISADWQPYERRAGNVFERQAPDSAYRYRPGEVIQNVMAHGMRPNSGGLQERLLAQSRWGAMRHFEVKGYPCDPVRPGLDVWPGTIVRLTDPELWTPDGTKGVTNRIAIVTGTSRSWAQDDDGRIEMSMACDLLVLGTRTSTPRVNGPVAQGLGFNSATGQMFCSDDWAGHGGGWSDALTFIESTYGTDFGGDLRIAVWQWDGVSTTRTMLATVTSVVTTPGSAHLIVTDTTGAYYRDMLTWIVAADSTEQDAAWAIALFGPISDDAGEWTDAAAATQSFIPWEA